MNEIEELPQTITTVHDLFAWLNQYPDEMKLDVRYDSGSGHGGFSPSSFSVIDGKLRIEVS
jgi:hypothetical protein